ncbi:hypothetical protein NLI96_g2664 [Meripilus lineatus]|uniref:BRCT domain-containing protein n=1 Tax=Meripilus lineatus TaxID=2056292 RepID=A0AAD5YLN5_9APHY|nr:hypothetical protein NLI96_g2664 [Physisporinus lineatus]
MEKYLNVTKTPTQPSQGGRVDKGKQRQDHKYNPYDVRSRDKQQSVKKEESKTAKFLAPLLKKNPNPSSTALRKHLLSTLSDEANPITHSDIPQRADYVTSAASGHQRGEGRGSSAQQSYNDFRSKKLHDQMPEQSSNLYINGYLRNSTDIEMKRIVSQAGGSVLYTASGATHILTSQQLSGTKTHKLLTSKGRTKPHVVRPEWVTDSINAGKRLPERTYSVITNNTTKDLTAMMVAGSSREVPIELD